MKHKIKNWIYRYLPAEIFGLLAAFAFSWIVQLITRDAVILAYAASLGDNVGFYGIIIIRDSLNARGQRKKENRKYVAADSLRICINLLLEFGGAEILDSIVIRPFFMYLFMHTLHNNTLGLLYGKVSADILFYGAVILSYELRKRFF